MTPIVAIFETDQLSLKQYDEMMQSMQNAGELPNQDLIVHICYTEGNTIHVRDVWKSVEALMAFAQKNLIPLFIQQGIQPLQPKILPLHNYVGSETVAAG